METRLAQKKDIENINKLLYQVAMIHHNIRPDLFKAGKKYTSEQLMEIINDKNRHIIVAVDENDEVTGCAFCIFKQYIDDNIMTNIKTLYIADLCVDEKIRGKSIGKLIYNEVISFAKKNNCYNVTLNVWEGNNLAKRFYENCGFSVQKTEMEIVL